MNEEMNQANTNEEAQQSNQPEAPKAVPTTPEQVDTLHELIRGHNDKFDKEYFFKETGQRFRIQVRYPSFTEKGRINALREEMLVGTGKYQPEGIALIFQTVALLEICGIDVPPYFSKDGSPREDFLYKIGVDLENWVYSFR